MTADLEILERRAAEARAKRAAFPFAARIGDELRSVFGKQCRVTYAREDGRTIGDPGPEGVVFTRCVSNLMEKGAS